MVISRGVEHDFLAIKIKLRKVKLVKLSMTKQLEEATEFFRSTCGYAVRTPGAPHVFEVNENAERLDAEKSRIFHSVAAKLLYVTKRIRPNKEPEVKYFTNWVSNSNMDYWKKMKCCITFLKQIKEHKRFIG